MTMQEFQEQFGTEEACNHQTTVTAGTIMEKTKTPLIKWFTAMYLVAENKRGLSAMALQKKSKRQSVS
jgi:hypothetical protein